MKDKQYRDSMMFFGIGIAGISIVVLFELLLTHLM